jgi:hypothetical protein
MIQAIDTLNPCLVLRLSPWGQSFLDSLVPSLRIRLITTACYITVMVSRVRHPQEKQDITISRPFGCEDYIIKHTRFQGSLNMEHQ